ncbi:MAG: ATP-binding protein [gamma proteobacterium symbiont of Taylorina sp.]|nr:ATP-binding protein [gamma proteobacterium symbiont of Taylorina sp.]
MQKYGLQRIILIDSFIPHISTYIDVDKHACMNGTNGGGKTTSLKLIPFFYGAEPSQLNPKVENKENFLDFYLPRTTSLIIFEYLREGGLNCAVAYRHVTSKISH